MMATSGGGAGTDAAGVAPFVAKTYRMVDDPATDGVIAWGRDNNSFVVADPFAFSQTLLPAYFKHANFSSFVRQLNTYGFRKVDPGRWEFAHVSFLRGQTHLLRQIARRSGGKQQQRNNKDDGCAGAGDGAAADEDAVAAEVVRLKREQRAIEDQVAAMWRRVQETERRPKQMLAFLLKVAGDPQVLRRLVNSSGSGPAATAAGISTAGSGVGAGVGFASSGPEDGREVAKRARLLLEDSDPIYGGGGGEDVGFGGEGYLQPPPYVFPVNSGY